MMVDPLSMLFRAWGQDQHLKRLDSGAALLWPDPPRLRMRSQLLRVSRGVCPQAESGRSNLNDPFAAQFIKRYGGSHKGEKHDLEKASGAFPFVVDQRRSDLGVECDRKRRYFSSGSRDEHPDRRRAWNYSDHHQARYQLRRWVRPL